MIQYVFCKAQCKGILCPLRGLSEVKKKCCQRGYGKWLIEKKRTFSKNTIIPYFTLSVSLICLFFLPVISLQTFGPWFLPPSLPSFFDCLQPHSLPTTPSLCSPSPDPLRPVRFTFPAVGNHAGAWLADKPSCWLMGRPMHTQLWEGRWTLVKRKRWQSHPPPTHP